MSLRDFIGDQFGQAHQAFRGVLTKDEGDQAAVQIDGRWIPCVAGSLDRSEDDQVTGYAPGRRVVLSILQTDLPSPVTSASRVHYLGRDFSVADQSDDVFHVVLTLTAES